MRVGIFELRDGADEVRAARFARAIAAIDYPWRRLIPRLRRDPDQAVVVVWDALGQQGTGLYYGGSRIEIHLSDLERDAAAEPFVIAHEVGHLVDDLTLTASDRIELSRAMHTPPMPQIGHFDHDHRDAGHVSEGWTDRRNHYPSMLNEAYADLFVEAFAPSIWGDRTWVRFTHHTRAAAAAVREITLRREIMVYADVPADHPHRESIERAAELGLVQGYADGTYRPEANLTRGQAATIAVRQYDRLREELAR